MGPPPTADRVFPLLLHGGLPLKPSFWFLPAGFLLERLSVRSVTEALTREPVGQHSLVALTPRGRPCLTRFPIPGGCSSHLVVQVGGDLKARGQQDLPLQHLHPDVLCQVGPAEPAVPVVGDVAAVHDLPEEVAEVVSGHLRGDSCHQGAWQALMSPLPLLPTRSAGLPATLGHQAQGWPCLPSDSSQQLNGISPSSTLFPRGTLQPPPCLPGPVPTPPPRSLLM